jgi:small subunit ribosomal protein S2
MKKDGTFMTLSKKERLQVDRLRAKLEKNLGSIADMSRLPAALFVVDIKAEHIAIKEAQKLNIPVFAMVDTNSDPREVDYVIPANDDASKSIDKILSLVTAAVIDGLANRTSDKEGDDTHEVDAVEEVTAAEIVEAAAEVEAPVAEAAPEVETVVEVEAAPEVEAEATETEKTEE